MLALATVAASARKQRLFLPRLPANEPTMLLTLSDNVLAIIRVCSQTAKGRSWYLPTTKSRLAVIRSEEHTSELQSLIRTPYAVFCLQTIHIQSQSSHRQHKHTRLKSS